METKHSRQVQDLIGDLSNKKSNTPAGEKRSDDVNSLFFNNTDEGIIITQDEKFCFVNSKMSEITGYSEEELTSKNFLEFTHPDDGEILLDWYRRHLRGQYTNVAYPFRFLTNKGNIKWLKGTSIRINWNGKPAVMGFVTDVTPQKQTKEQPNSAEMLFKELFNNSHIGAFNINLEGNLLYVNRSFADIFGYDSPEEMLSDKTFKVKHKETLLGLIQSVEKTHNIKNLMIEVITKKGRSKSLCCDVIRHQDIVFSMISNVGECTPIEKQLQQNSKALQTLLSATHDIALLIDPKGIIHAINKTAAEKFGGNPDAVIGSKVYNFMTNQVASFRKTQLNKAFQTKRPVRYHERRNGRIYHSNIYPIIDPDGEVQLIAIFAQDITKQIQSKKSMHESHAELECKVAEYTKELKRKARQLEEANIALKVLLKKREEDKIDLENRLMSSTKELILPYVNKLKRRISDEKQMTYLSILESNMNSILTPFSRRLSAVYSMLTPSEIEVAELIKFGRRSKEIAELLSVSVKTVETHRAKIRKKVGLTNKKANLRTYLLSFNK